MPFDATPPVRIDTDASRLIEAGIARIRKQRNWCKGKTRQRRFLWMEQSCLMGAVFPTYIGCGFDDFYDIEKRAYVALRKAAERRGFNHPITFNDNRHTTHADVIACMHEAAELAKNHSP